MSTQERRERERARRRRLIVTVARELAEAEGWEAVTTRRLAERIEYSQPVLYSHFAGKDAIVAAVALEGFAELTAELGKARLRAEDPREALSALIHAYADFARLNPSLYDAMLTLAVDLPFGRPGTPAPLQAAFAEFREAIAAFADDRDTGVLAEIAWGSVHGLVTLTRSGRLPAAHHERRLAMLIDQLTAPAGGGRPAPAAGGG
ncbi:TetR/AcrR family transcriptional regulator [Streptosporangium sp. NPDC049046]|uniref:TetR/AcrR family transcriptional regulator n=1 Tax=unclassified Streptosporangium TaxID=2632669 RepID=UPI00342247C5